MEQVETPSTIATIVAAKPQDFVESTINDRRTEELGRMLEYDPIASASTYMKYGDCLMMLRWCERQGNGTSPPFGMKRIYGIPLPFFSFASLLFVMMAIRSGLPSTYVTMVGVVSSLFFISAGFLFADYKYDRAGICFICGAESMSKYKEGMQVYDHKQKKYRVTRAGYCTTCEHPVHRQTHWAAVVSSIKQMIKGNPVKEPRWYRTIGYNLLWPFGYVEEYTDPRPSPDRGRTAPPGRGYFYKNKDFKRPRDVLNEVKIDNAIRYFAMGLDILTEVRKETVRRI